MSVRIPAAAQRFLNQIGAASTGNAGIANAIWLALGGGIGSLTPRAKGGPVVKGQAYVVGEKRPELFVPNTDGTIVPSLNAKTLNAASSPSVVITGGTFIGSTRADAARWLSDIIREGKARGLVMS